MNIAKLLVIVIWDSKGKTCQRSEIPVGLLNANINAVALELWLTNAKQYTGRRVCVMAEFEEDSTPDKALMEGTLHEYGSI